MLLYSPHSHPEYSKQHTSENCVDLYHTAFNRADYLSLYSLLLNHKQTVASVLFGIYTHRKVEEWIPLQEAIRSKLFSSRKHAYIILTPLNPTFIHFYIVKLGFTEVYIIFLISAQKHRLWVLVRTASPGRF